MCCKISLPVCVIAVSGMLCVAQGFAQHPGAYSSPHYAKKSIHYSQPYDQPSPYNEPEYQKISTIDRKDGVENSKHQEIDLADYSNDQKAESSVERYQTVDNNRVDVFNATETHAGRSFMAGAANFLNGRGGQMLADIAKELIARSTGATSQVLSLNLTNLVILVVLKALILAAGMFGAGAWHHGYARSLDEDNSLWIEDKELSLWMGYLEGGDNICLLRSACENPSLSSRYTSGADILMTAAKLLQGTIPYDERYEIVLAEVKEASKWGSTGKSCDGKYKKCSKHPEK